MHIVINANDLLFHLSGKNEALGNVGILHSAQIFDHESIGVYEQVTVQLFNASTTYIIDINQVWVRQAGLG